MNTSCEVVVGFLNGHTVSYRFKDQKEADRFANVARAIPGVNSATVRPWQRYHTSFEARKLLEEKIEYVKKWR